ncbi:MAG: PD-(D/E)XK nuclease domain-containing protein [Candidatus Riflebacteria bacterium]|nr:PD-(D/E)XK nuclease domain-containing protein [Candidatus Riflebacteria bacterium]
MPYGIQIKNEKYYQTIFFSLFRLVGTSIKTEIETSDGRIDAVVENDTNIYIFEFKLDKSAEVALDQIINKEYYEPFLNSGKKITLIGANFNSETRKLCDWVKKELKKMVVSTIKILNNKRKNDNYNI